MLFRYRARNFPGSLNESEQQRWQEHCAARLHGGEANARTLSQFFDQIDNLSEHVDERGEAILGALYDYAESIAPPLA